MNTNGGRENLNGGGKNEMYTSSSPVKLHEPFLLSIKNLLIGALIFIAAFGLNNFFLAIFDLAFGKRYYVVGKLIYAIMITLLVLIMIYGLNVYFEKKGV